MRAPAHPRVGDEDVMQPGAPAVPSVVPEEPATTLEPAATLGLTYLTCYLCYGVLIVFGHLRDFFGKLCACSRYSKRTPAGYAPLLHDWESFFTRRLYHRIQDCWNRPIAGPPYSSRLAVVLRDSSDGNKTMAVSGGTQQCINLGSYNYLGFADDWDSTCRTDVLASAEAFPTSMCTSLAEGGYTSLHADVEACVASFLGKEAAAVFNMGWATNALGLPALLGGKGTLIVSDALNHNSIVSGARSSGAVVRVFRHNDLTGLKELLRAAIRDGQERTHRPWRKIVIAVEGIYSMEGEFCDLAGVVAIAKAHKCFVYLDEAHSIGATGATGRGVCEKAGVDPADVDVLMGTFTKSFGAMGGYIAGSRALVSMIKRRSGGFLVDNAMAPAVAQQVLTSLRVMSGRDGTTVGARKLAALQQNCRAFREGLKRLGVETLGEEGSPVVPMLVYHPTKLARFSRECLQRNLAVVVVGFPATPLVSCRARFCISAGHTPEDIARALVIIEEVVDLLKLRYKRSFLG